MVEASSYGCMGRSSRTWRIDSARGEMSTASSAGLSDPDISDIFQMEYTDMDIPRQVPGLGATPNSKLV
jgi:hypothetical protein